jgi:hypothetical protein
MERIRNWAFEVEVVKMPTRLPDNEGSKIVELYRIKGFSLELGDLVPYFKDQAAAEFPE